MTIPRFNARHFNAFTQEMKNAYARDGIVVLDQMVTEAQCDLLRTRMAEMMADFDYESHRTIFSTTELKHVQEDYFLESGHKTRFFFEDGAFDETGSLTCAPELAVNKVGHAMHDTDPVFSDFARQPRFKTLCKGLGLIDPLILQSMYIFKQPNIGGEVTCHQDASFLWTEPQSVIGIWVALEDATVENGCLWGLPGEHNNSSTPKQRFHRTKDGNVTQMDILDETPFDLDKSTPIEAPKGTVLAFSGLFPHMSGKNLSADSRHALTLHIIDGTAHYPADNWLKRPENMPPRGFE